MLWFTGLVLAKFLQLDRSAAQRCNCDHQPKESESDLAGHQMDIVYKMEWMSQTETWVILAKCILTVAVMWLSYQVLEERVLTPMRIKRVLARQGVTGPPPKWLTGNVLEKNQLMKDACATDMKTGDYNHVQRLMPEHVLWTKQYGKTHVWWNGPEARLTIDDLELTKELLLNKNGFIEKGRNQLTLFRSLAGRGLVATDGEEWALHRRVVSPAFQHDKIKDMIGAMETSASIMLREWEMIVENGGGSAEVEAHGQMVKVTADIISRTAFGSSYEKGKKVIEYQLELGKILGQRLNSAFRSLPGYSILPTKMNLKRRKLEKGLAGLLEEIIHMRTDAVKEGGRKCYGNDLLGLMLAAAHKDTASVGGKVHFGMQALIGECKTFFFAGHETTASLLTWALMFLGTHTEWQDRAREEVMDLCEGGCLPNLETINKMKVIGMILNETLRLCPPIVTQIRQAVQDVKLGHLDIPKGLCFSIPRAPFHQNPELWGDDALQFKPERFKNGVANASKHLFAFMPFSYGPQYCVGQGFALQEAKIVMAMLLQKFRFRLSPNYRHSPEVRVTLTPKHGVQLVVERVT